MRLFVAFVFVLGAWAQGHVAPPPKPAAPDPKLTETKPAPPAASSAPKPSKSETLHYNVNWPSGLSLGEGKLTSSFENDRWSIAFSMEASIPGFVLREVAKSTATAAYCSLELEKNGTRGKRTVDETTTFDQKSHTATRQTNKGGKSELATSACAKDALAFVFFLRHELAAGRLPQAQKIYYGAPYQVRVQFIGTQTLRISGEPTEADRVTATIKGPASEITVDLFFARDAVRTPVLIQTPLAMGKFALELTR
jgi:Protein of unknown function (DUF3108)